MSIREKYIALADRISDDQMICIVNMIQAFIDSDHENNYLNAVQKALDESERGEVYGPFATIEDMMRSLDTDD